LRVKRSWTAVAALRSNIVSSIAAKTIASRRVRAATCWLFPVAFRKSDSR
jgi:hypothetical protein